MLFLINIKMLLRHILALVNIWKPETTQESFTTFSTTWIYVKKQESFVKQTSNLSFFRKL